MGNRVLQRLQDIESAITHIETILEGKSRDDLLVDRVAQAALERFLEIISEASRHIPVEIKRTEEHIPWRRVGDLGNHLRHAYHRVDVGVLWALHADGDLLELKAAVIRLMNSRTDDTT